MRCPDSLTFLKCHMKVSYVVRVGKGLRVPQHTLFRRNRFTPVVCRC